MSCVCLYVTTLAVFSPGYIGPAGLSTGFSLMRERKDESFDVATGHALPSCLELFGGKTQTSCYICFQAESRVSLAASFALYHL